MAKKDSIHNSINNHLEKIDGLKQLIHDLYTGTEQVESKMEKTNAAIEKEVSKSKKTMKNAEQLTRNVVEAQKNVGEAMQQQSSNLKKANKEIYKVTSEIENTQKALNKALKGKKIKRKENRIDMSEFFDSAVKIEQEADAVFKSLGGKLGKFSNLNIDKEELKKFGKIDTKQIEKFIGIFSDMHPNGNLEEFKKQLIDFIRLRDMFFQNKQKYDALNSLGFENLHVSQIEEAVEYLEKMKKSGMELSRIIGRSDFSGVFTKENGLEFDVMLNDKNFEKTIEGMVQTVFDSVADQFTKRMRLITEEYDLAHKDPSYKSKLQSSNVFNNKNAKRQEAEPYYIEYEGYVSSRSSESSLNDLMAKVLKGEKLKTTKQKSELIGKLANLLRNKELTLDEYQAINAEFTEDARRFVDELLELPNYKNLFENVYNTIPEKKEKSSSNKTKIKTKERADVEEETARRIENAVEREVVAVEQGEERKRKARKKTKKEWYRTVSDLDEVFTENGHAWFINSLQGAESYRNTRLHSSGNDRILKTDQVDMSNVYSFDANGALRKEITWLGDGSDEASKKITGLYNTLKELRIQEKELQAQLDSSWTEELEHQYDQLFERICQVSSEYEKISNDKTNMYGTHDTRWFQQTAESLGYLGLEIKNVIDLGDMANRSNNELFTSDILALFDKNKISALHDVTDGINELVAVTQKIKPFKIPTLEIAMGEFESIDWKQYTDEERKFAEAYNELANIDWLTNNMKEEIGWKQIISELTERKISYEEALVKLKNGIAKLSGETQEIDEELNDDSKKNEPFIEIFPEINDEQWIPIIKQRLREIADSGAASEFTIPLSPALIDKFVDSTQTLINALKDNPEIPLSPSLIKTFKDNAQSLIDKLCEASGIDVSLTPKLSKDQVLENDDFENEKKQLNELSKAIEEVKRLIEKKNAAFIHEGKIVASVIPDETKHIGRLISALTHVLNKVIAISEAINSIDFSNFKIPNNFTKKDKEELEEKVREIEERKASEKASKKKNDSKGQSSTTAETSETIAEQGLIIRDNQEKAHEAASEFINDEKDKQKALEATDAIETEQKFRDTQTRGSKNVDVRKYKDGYGQTRTEKRYEKSFKVKDENGDFVDESVKLHDTITDINFDKIGSVYIKAWKKVEDIRKSIATLDPNTKEWKEQTNQLGYYLDKLEDIKNQIRFLTENDDEAREYLRNYIKDETELYYLQNDIKNARSEDEKGKKIAALSREYGKKLSGINNAFKDTDQYREIEEAIKENNLRNTEDIDSMMHIIENLFNEMEQEINKFKQNVVGSNTLDPVVSAQNRYNNLENSIDGFIADFKNMGYSADEAKEKVSKLRSLLAKLKENKSKINIWEFGERFKEISEEEQRISKLIPVERKRKKVEAQENKLVIEQYDLIINKLKQLAKAREKLARLQDEAAKHPELNYSKDIENQRNNINNIFNSLGRMRSTKFVSENAKVLGRDRLEAFEQARNEAQYAFRNVGRKEQLRETQAKSLELKKNIKSNELTKLEDNLKKAGKLTDEVKKGIDNLSASLSKVSSTADLSNWNNELKLFKQGIDPSTVEKYDEIINHLKKLKKARLELAKLKKEEGKNPFNNYSKDIEYQKKMIDEAVNGLSKLRSNKFITENAKVLGKDRVGAFKQAQYEAQSAFRNIGNQENIRDNQKTEKKVNGLLDQQRKKLEAIYKIREKISRLDPEKNSKEISALKNQEEARKKELRQTYVQLEQYADIYDKENQLFELRKISSEYTDKINHNKAKNEDSYLDSIRKEREKEDKRLEREAKAQKKRIERKEESNKNKLINDSYALSNRWLKEQYALEEKIARAKETNSKTQSSDIAYWESKIKQLKSLLEVESAYRKANGLSDSNKDIFLNRQKETLKWEYDANREAHSPWNFYDEAHAANKEFDKNVNIKKANELIEEQKSDYEAIYKIREEISRLDSEKKASKIASLKEEEKKLQTTYIQRELELGQYEQLIDKEKHLAELRKISEKYERKIRSNNADKEDEARNKAKKELEASIEKFNKLQKEREKADKKDAENQNRRANELIDEKLKALERNNRLKIEKAEAEKKGVGTSFIDEQIKLENKYIKRLNKEIEYYKATQAYKDKDDIFRGKKSDLRTEFDKRVNKGRLDKNAASEEAWEIYDAINQTQSVVEKFKTLNNLDDNNLLFVDYTEKIKKLNDELIKTGNIDKYNASIKNLTNTMQSALYAKEDRFDLFDKLEKHLKDTKQFDKYKDKLDVLADKLLNASSKQELGLFDKEFGLFRASVKAEEAPIIETYDKIIDKLKELKQAREKLARFNNDADKHPNVDYSKDIKYQKDLIDSLLKDLLQLRDYSFINNNKDILGEDRVKEYKQRSYEATSANDRISNEEQIRNENHAQKELNDSIAIFNQIQKDREQTRKINEKDATSLIVEEIKAYERLNDLKIKRTEADKKGQDTTAIEERIKLEKEYIDRLEEELELYKETIAYKDKDSIINNKKIELGSVYDDRVNRGRLSFESAEEEAWALHNAMQSVSDVLQDIKISKGLDDDDLVTKAAQEKIDELNKKLINTKNLDSSAINKYVKDVQKVFDNLNNIVHITSPDLDEDEFREEVTRYLNVISDGNVKIDKFDYNNKKVFATLDDGKGSIRKVTLEYDKLTGALRNVKNEGKETQTLFGKILSFFSTKFKNLVGYILSFGSVHEIWAQIRQGVTYVRELNTALTEMRKVSDESVESLKRFQKESFDVANSIGTTAKQVQDSTSSFMRLGYELKEASKLAEDANIYANVGDMEIGEATEHMISSIKAWESEFTNDVEASAAIVDRYNEIGNNFAISSADIGAAMERSAAALKAGGNTLNESLGLITAGNVIQQDAETTAAALKILSLRIRGSKAELEEMGEETDNLADSSSKLREQIKALSGVDIMKDENTYKSTAQIIKELGAAYDKMSDISQASLLETIAGKNRASTVEGLLQNYEIIDEVIQAAEKADGSALKENQKYLESIDGKIEQLANSVQEFWFTVLDTDTVTWVLSSLTSVIQGVTTLIDKLGTVPSLFGVIGAALGAVASYKTRNSGGRARNFVVISKLITHRSLIKYFRY